MKKNKVIGALLLILAISACGNQSRETTNDISRTGSQNLAGINEATMEFGNKLAKLVAIKIAGEPLTGELGVWVETLPVSIRDRLARIGILDAEQALNDALSAFHHGLEHVTLTVVELIP